MGPHAISTASLLVCVSEHGWVLGWQGGTPGLDIVRWWWLVFRFGEGAWGGERLRSGVRAMFRVDGNRNEWEWGWEWEWEWGCEDRWDYGLVEKMRRF